MLVELTTNTAYVSKIPFPSKPEKLTYLHQGIWRTSTAAAFVVTRKRKKKYLAPTQVFVNKKYDIINFGALTAEAAVNHRDPHSMEVSH